jgi:hypothetical protein
LLLAYVIVPEETVKREAEKFHMLIRQLEGK